MRPEGRSMRWLPAAILATVLVPASAGSSPGEAAEPSPLPLERTRAVDLVICLDTSGSMEGLLDAARARLWDIVSEFARMRPTPALRIGLLTYGTEEATALDGWIVEQLDLTDDLDSVYGRLTGLNVGGGVELVGRALSTAVERMSWSRDPDALRIIFLAGNEHADQGAEDHDFRDVATGPDQSDIIINALYAGSREQGIVEGWDAVARHGFGNFSAIDPETSTIQIPTPQDDALLALNRQLNTTYLPYGPSGADGLANQLAQDSNASRLGVESCSSRIVAKGSALYTNASWDLVDAAVQEEFDLRSLADADLPEEMRGMTDAERSGHIERKRADREEIQTRIQELSAQRETYIQEVRARERMAAGLDDAMREAIRAQAKAKGLTCDGC